MSKKPVKKPGGAAVKKSLKKQTGKGAKVTVKSTDTEKAYDNMIESSFNPAFAPQPDDTLYGESANSYGNTDSLYSSSPFTWTKTDTVILIAGLVVGAIVYFAFIA